MNENELFKLFWDELRLQCCSTKLNAKRIVQVSEEDVKEVAKKLKDKVKPINNL